MCYELCIVYEYTRKDTSNRKLGNCVSGSSYDAQLHLLMLPVIYFFTIEKIEIEWVLSDLRLHKMLTDSNVSLYIGRVLLMESK